MANQYKLSSYVYPSVNSNAIQKYQVNTQYKENATLYYDGILYQVLATYVSDATSIINDLINNKIKALGIVRLTQSQRLSWANPYDGAEVYQIDNGNSIWTYSSATGQWSNNNSGCYLSATLSTSQNTNLGGNNHVMFNTILDKIGNRII
jgi:hypothetical protein